MSLRRKFEKKIREKQQEIQELDTQITRAKAYVEAMQDAMRLIPAEANGDVDELLSEVTIKPGSAMADVLRVLRESGKPLHIMDLLRSIGKDATPENRASVGSSLSSYVRKGALFTRPAPNTFGLAEWGQAASVVEGPPDGFGSPSS